MLILRDMIVGTTRFNDLARGLPGLSRTLLTKRLRQFERAGLVDRDGNQYLLTDAGRSLEPVVFGLGEWGAQYAFGEPEDDELDPELLVWWMHTRIDTTSFPGRRHVVHVRFTDDARQYWIVIESGVPSVCHSDPGYDVNISIVADVRTLYRVWLGRLTIKDALASGHLEFVGAPAWTRRMPSVLQLSAMADYVRAGMG